MAPKSFSSLHDSSLSRHNSSSSLHDSGYNSDHNQGHESGPDSSHDSDFMHGSQNLRILGELFS